MNKSLVLKNKIYFYLSFLFTFFLFVYLLYFLVNGERGLLKYFSVKNLNAQLTQLTQEQADYIGVDKAGPYKPDSYRY